MIQAKRNDIISNRKAKDGLSKLPSPPSSLCPLSCGCSFCFLSSPARISLTIYRLSSINLTRWMICSILLVSMTIRSCKNETRRKRRDCTFFVFPCFFLFSLFRFGFVDFSVDKVMHVLITYKMRPSKAKEKKRQLEDGRVKWEKQETSATTSFPFIFK